MAFDMNNLILAPEDSISNAQPGWLCDFYFGYGCDVIEQDALNEKYCIQVLRILITKADTEIDELEKDLVSLQSELAWAEYEEWSDICCNALRKNIDSLHTSVRNLKSKEKNDMEFHLSIKPAEALHEIMKALLRDLFREQIKQNEQPLDVVVLNNSDSPGQATDDLELVGDFSRNPLELVAGHPDEKKVLGSFDYKDVKKGEGREHDFTPKKKKMVQDLTLKSADERRQNLEMVEVQPTEIDLKNSCRNALKHAVTYCKRKKPLNISDLKIISEEAKDYITSADALILESSMNPMGKSTNISTKVKLENAVVKASVSDACRHETGHCIEMIKMCMSDSEVSTVNARSKLLTSSLNPEGEGNPPKADKPANAIMRNIRADALRNATGLSGRRNNSDCKLATSGQAKGGNSNTISNVLRHPSGLIGRRNNSDPGLTTSRQVKLENADGIPAALRHATGLNQRRNDSDSRLGAVRQENGGNCDINQKLCDFAQKVARKQNINESKFTLADKTESPDLSSEADGSKKHSQLLVKVEKVDLTDTKNSTSTSILDLQIGKGKDTTKKLPEKGTMQPELQLAETFANNEKFNLDFYAKPQNQKAKRKTESSSPSVQEPVSLPAKMSSNAPSILKAKMHCKAGIGSDGSGSNQSLGRKTMKKKFRSRQYEGEENSCAMKEEQNLNLQPQKKRKKNSGLPIVVEIKGSTLQLDLSKLQSDPNDSTGKDEILITESYSIVSHSEAVPSSDSATSILKDLKVGDLRAIAKEKKLSKYYKLRKSDLIERIANHLRC